MTTQRHTPCRRATVLQFARYAFTGALNTLITLLVIIVTKSLLGINPWLANALGYVAGFINSFILSKLWVFRTHGNTTTQAIRFTLTFAIAYALQLTFTWLLTTRTPLAALQFHIPLTTFTLSGYGIATLAGMVLYTLISYFLNRRLTFRQK